MSRKRNQLTLLFKYSWWIGIFLAIDFFIYFINLRILNLDRFFFLLLFFEGRRWIQILWGYEGWTVDYFLLLMLWIHRTFTDNSEFFFFSLNMEMWWLTVLFLFNSLRRLMNTFPMLLKTEWFLVALRADLKSCLCLVVFLIICKFHVLSKFPSRPLQSRF